MDKKPGQRRKKIFFFQGFQLRYTALVAGSLLVMLMFAGFHGFYVAQEALPEAAYLDFKPNLIELTLRLVLVGLIYVAVLIMAAAFLAHRTVGPTYRMTEKLKEMAKPGKVIEPLHVREGDDFEYLAEGINKLIKKMDKSK